MQAMHFSLPYPDETGNGANETMQIGNTTTNVNITVRAPSSVKMKVNAEVKATEQEIISRKEAKKITDVQKLD